MPTVSGKLSDEQWLKDAQLIEVCPVMPSADFLPFWPLYILAYMQDKEFLSDLFKVWIY